MNQIGQQPDEFREAFESALDRLQSDVLAACASEDEWPAQVAAAIRAALAFAATNPAAARVLSFDAMTNGRRGFTLYNRMVEQMAAGLLAGRAESPEGVWLPEITEKAMVGGFATLIAQRIEQGQHAELPAIAPEAIQFVLTPYIGADRALAVAKQYSA
jgi:hypothetical protein